MVWERWWYSRWRDLVVAGVLLGVGLSVHTWGPAGDAPVLQSAMYTTTSTTVSSVPVFTAVVTPLDPELTATTTTITTTTVGGGFAAAPTTTRSAPVAQTRAPTTQPATTTTQPATTVPTSSTSTTVPASTTSTTTIPESTEPVDTTDSTGDTTSVP